MVRTAYILWKKEENTWSTIDIYTKEELGEVVKEWNLTHNDDKQETMKGLMDLKVSIYKKHNDWDCVWTCEGVLDPSEEVS